jgi:hypothetical protein
MQHVVFSMQLRRLDANTFRVSIYLHVFFIIMSTNSDYFPIQRSRVKDITARKEI